MEFHGHKIHVFPRKTPDPSSKSHGRVHHEVSPSRNLPLPWRFCHQPKPTRSYIFHHWFAFWWMSRRLGGCLAYLPTCLLSKPKNEHASRNHLTNHHDMACAKHVNPMSHNLTLMSGIWKAWDVNACGLKSSAQIIVFIVFGCLRMDVSILFS